MNDFFSLAYRSLPLLMKGTKLTLEVLILSMIISLIAGIIFGALSADRFKIPLISPIVRWVTFMLRAIPFYVQLLIVYFVLPDLFGWNLEPFPASVLALGLCSSGYVSQIIKSGTDSLPSCQWEGAYCLGYNSFQTLRYIILPQVVRNMLPALAGEVDAMLKSTAIVSSIGLLELTRAGMNLVSREMEPIPIYLMVAFLYLLLSALLNFLMKKVKRRLSYA